MLDCIRLKCVCLLFLSQFGWRAVGKGWANPFLSDGQEALPGWEKEAVNRDEELWTRAHGTGRVLCLLSPVSSLASEEHLAVHVESRTSVPGNGSDPDQNMGWIERHRLQNGAPGEFWAYKPRFLIVNLNSAFQAALWMHVAQKHKGILTPELTSGSEMTLEAGLYGSLHTLVACLCVCTSRPYTFDAQSPFCF